MVFKWNWGELFTGGLTSFGLGIAEWCVILCAVLLICLVSKLGKDVPLRHRIASRPVAWCACACALLVLVLIFGAYGIGYDASQFIYTQF